MTAEGRVDETGFAAHLASMAAADGIAGLLVNGHAGEGHLLTRAEKRALLTRAREAMGPGRFITAGVTAEATDEACREAADAAEAGADAVLVFQPNHWARGVGAASVVAHHEAIAAASGLPLVIYRAPLGWGPMSYPLELVLTLTDLDAVIGIKEGSWDVAAYEELWRAVKARNPGVAVLASGDEHLLACFQVGTDGSQVSLAAVFPELVTGLFAAAERGDWDEARRLHERVWPLARAIYRDPPGHMATPRLKAALKALGRLACDRVRRPGRELDAAETARLVAAMAGEM
jgi:4-hydroxy-tetrahydrodipicolinate synthase